jgi:hypothetical protein
MGTYLLKAFCFHGEKQERANLAKDIMQPAIDNDMDRRSWNIWVTTYEVCNTKKILLSKFAWQSGCVTPHFHCTFDNNFETLK